MEPNTTTECLLRMLQGSPNQQTSSGRFWLMTLMVSTVLLVLSSPHNHTLPYLKYLFLFLIMIFVLSCPDI